MLDEYPETLTSGGWHDPDWTPSGSELIIPEYQIRSEFYGIDIIPTTEWNGEQETEGATSGFDWEIMYNTFIPIYNQLNGQEKPYEIEIEGKHAVVVGRSPNLGKPMAMMLLNANATVTICHSRTKNLKEQISTADIIVGAVGIPKFIQGDWIKDNAIVIDAGYHPEKCGDIDLDQVIERSVAYTPVPGGGGPMTINTLIVQTVEACENS